MVEPPEQVEKEQAVAPPVPPRRSAKRGWLVFAAVALIGVIAAGAWAVAGRDTGAPDTGTNGQEAAESEPEPKTSIRLLATGDWIAHDSLNDQAKTDEGYNYAQFLTAMKPFFADSDVNFCNQATLAAGEQFGISGYPAFNAPTQWIDDMRGFGCNLINTGTNHTNDKGQRPITAQLNYWDEQEGVFAVAGSNRRTEEQREVRYFEAEGVKFAFLSYSTYTNIANPNPYSLNMFNEPLVTEQMTEARQQADIVIVSMRWGTEYSSEINPAQEAAAQKLADLGADIVLGHGQHVLGPVKRLTGAAGRETIVWHGLGNFLNTQLETEALTGCVAQFDIDISSKKVTQNLCLPFYMHYEWTAEQAAASDLLARRNIQMVPLFNAQDLIAKSQLQTTAEAQMDRIRTIVNMYAEVPVINAQDM